MAGIYLHIPFCKQTCHYCDFHFSTNLESKEKILSAMWKEMELRKDYLKGEKIQTIYFGGGTPSLLSSDELKRFFETIHENFEVDKNVEITLEANPDDLSSEKIQMLADSEVNRLSIGIQSFLNRDLQLLNRAHSANEAWSSVKKSQDAGFENITIDLIYGIPGLTEKDWLKNIETAVELKVPHISAYSLTVEEKTPLEAFIRKGKIKPVDDEAATRHFEILMDELWVEGFEHYEISNFAKKGFHSQHNSSYWKGRKYLGIGPSAHSYDKESRQWNIANNHRYAAAIENGKGFSEKEILSRNDKINEYILTKLRLKEGIDLKEIEEYHDRKTSEDILNRADVYLKEKKAELVVDKLRLTRAGKFFADRIAADLFVE